MIGSLGLQELLLILVIVLIVFGAGKLPSVGASLGKAIKGFKTSIADDKPEEQAEGQVANPEAGPQPSQDKPGQTKPPA